jgi:hypothetical protein
MWLCLNTARRHRHSIESDEFRFDSHPIRGRIDRLAEIQSKSDRLLASFNSNIAFNVQTERKGFAVPRPCCAPNSEGVFVEVTDV